MYGYFSHETDIWSVIYFLAFATICGVNADIVIPNNVHRYGRDAIIPEQNMIQALVILY